MVKQEVWEKIPNIFKDCNDLRADYIIVGTGPAACAAARRITDSTNSSVLMFEAGEDNDKNPLICCLNGQTEPPFSSTIANFANEFFYINRSVPQPNLNGRTLDVNGGRLFGGGSSANGALWVRGSEELYKQWVAALGGDQSWSPANVEKLLKELENYNGTSQNPETRGVGGPVNVRQVQVGAPEQAIQQAFVSMAQGTGVPIVNDYNTVPLPGPAVGIHQAWQLTQFPDGRRASASVNLLPDTIIERIGENAESKIAVGRNGRKLLIIFKTTVLKVLMNKKKVPEACGVTWLRDGTTLGTAYANKRVIVAGGINSAPLLQRSGVGPKAILDAANVEVIVDNPNIGATFEDQQLFFPLFLAPPNFKPTDFTSPYLGGAFLPDPRLLLPNPPTDVTLNERAVEFYCNFLPTQVEIAPGVFYNIYLLISENLKPTSIGSIKIQNADPFKPYLVDFGFIDQRDRDILKAMIQVYIQRFQNYVTANLGWIPLTFTAGFSDEVVNTLINNNVNTSYHYAKINPMALPEKGGAVDGIGRVYGANRLHIMDNSIQYIGEDGNPQANSYLIGWKISKDIINLDHNEPIPRPICNKDNKCKEYEKILEKYLGNNSTYTISNGVVKSHSKK